jgi:zinc protease
MTYHAPGVRSQDAAALRVLAEVMGGGESARLHRQLVYRQRIARSAHAGYDFTSPDPTLFTVSARPLPDKPVSEVERALLTEIERIKSAGPTERELQKARNSIEAELVFAQDSLFYQGLLLGQYEIAGDWRWIDDTVPAIRAVDREDVLRVARFYLDADNRTVGTLVPLPSLEQAERPQLEWPVGGHHQ